MKKAILFGLNYKGQQGELKGCINDAEDMSQFLLVDKKYDSVKLYTSARTTSNTSIVRKMYNLAIESWRKDLQEVCIYYSGHGMSVDRRFNENKWWRDIETDGCDECLVPTDHQTRGVIPDNLIKRILRYFNPRTRVVVVVDACHSGTMCDLKYTFDQNIFMNTRESRCRANIICVSGCKDEQYSYENNVNGVIRGVLTLNLLKTLRQDNVTNIGDIQKKLNAYVEQTHYPQNPQITCSYEAKTYDKLFL